MASSKSSNKQNKQEVNLIAVFSYIGILVLIPLLVAKEDEFAQYHAKQGLLLLIVGVIGMVIGIIPIIGWLLAPLVTIAWIVFAVIGIVNVVKHKKKPLPIIGQYSDKVKL